MDDFELRVLGISSKKDDGEDDDLLRELEEIERSASWRAAGPAEGESGGDDSDLQDDEDDEEWEDERGQVLSDAALSAIVDYDLDDEQRPYQFRPDRLFFPGQTYDPEVMIHFHSSFDMSTRNAVFCFLLVEVMAMEYI